MRGSFEGRSTTSIGISGRPLQNQALQAFVWVRTVDAEENPSVRPPREPLPQCMEDGFVSNFEVLRREA